LIAGENDTVENAHNLGRLLQGIDCVVNVIPLNPTQGYTGVASQTTAVSAFQAILWEYGIRSTVRQRLYTNLQFFTCLFIVMMYIIAFAPKKYGTKQDRCLIIEEIYKRFRLIESGILLFRRTIK